MPFHYKIQIVGCKLTDLEIYELAGKVISSIAGDMQDGIYSDLDGELSIVWSQEKIIQAWAESKGSIDKSPSHKIGFHYELIRQVYRDIELYCEYIESQVDKNIFNMWFQNDVQPYNLLTSHFAKEAYINNIFMAALTWVFFHELGHLKQEHGYIRNKFTNITISLIHETNVNNNEEIQGREAAISHVTEMAADFEAIDTCIFELIRQFQGEELKPAIYEFICGVSCVLYRFHGAKPFTAEHYPQGSHPNPLIRLENIIPQIYEFFSMEAVHQVIKVELTREDMVKICSSAATSVGLFWLRNNRAKVEVEDNYFLMGSWYRPGMESYLKVIIEIWDEIEPTIKKIRRFGTDFGLLRFSQENRDRLENITKHRS